MLLRCGCTISIGSSTFAAVVRHGSMTGFWNAMPAMLTGPETASPATRTRPALGNWSPVTSFMRVDLPQPDGPTTATNSPSATERLSPSTASVPSTAPWGR